MNTKLQNKAWSVLPKEFKKEVKKEYYHDDSNPFELAQLEAIFGIHNLISDAEGEEMLMCEKSKVQKVYNTSREVVKAENPDSLMYSMHTQIMCVLENIFGSKCLPDELNEDNFAKSEPKPAEPKFKIGDKVRVKFNAKELHSNPDPSKKIYYWQTARDKYLGKVFKITDIWKSGTITLNTAELMFWEPFDLEPYTEPEENQNPSDSKELKPQDVDKHFGNILKDGFRNERRLNIAAQILSGIVASGKPCRQPVKRALELTDALVAECEKGDNHA